jgi:hypothetical protein
MIPEIWISLIIEEEAVDDELLNIFSEMGATDSWHKGETKGRSIITYEYNGCAFKSQPIRDLSVEDATNHFWDHFKLERNGLHKIVQKHDLAPILSIAVYASDVMPSIHFDSSVLKKLSLFNIGIDIDVILSE